MPLPRFEKLDEPRRRSILAAAAEEFGERGFENASYNRIIERAGISKGAMYYYFADKDDLFRTVLDAAIVQWLTNVGFPFEADDATSFWSACKAMYARSLRFMLEDPQNGALCLAIVNARARMEGHPALLALNDQMQMFTAQLVGQGQRLGAVRDDIPADLIVQAALALMDAGDRWLAKRWSEITPEAVDATAAMMVGLFRRLGEPKDDEG
ncbi:MAG: TetR/AcrR family transcriptional regulator [Sandaracinaceae bacterium]